MRKVILAIICVILTLSTSTVYGFSPPINHSNSKGNSISPFLLKKNDTVVNETAVTLITGDLVHVYTLKDGSLRVSIDPADPSVTGRSFSIFRGRDGLYVVPSDVDLGKFDRKLFNVNLLIKQGLNKLDFLPIIAEGIDLSLITELISTMKTESYPSRILSKNLNLASIEMSLKDKVKMWKTYNIIKDLQGLEKVWLDEKIKLNLNESTSLIGASYSWINPGVSGKNVKIAFLDTGIDPSHPDFGFPNGTSKILAMKSFVEYPEDEVGDPIDHFGHGTHVASIATGTGLAMLNGSGFSSIAYPLISRSGNDEGSILAGNGTHLAMVWHSDISGNCDVWYSMYNGKNWTVPYQLTSNSAWNRWPSVAFLKDGSVVVVWASNRTGSWSIWYKIYSDGYWTDDYQLSMPSPYNTSHYNYVPAITQLNNGTAAIAWTSNASGNFDVVLGYYNLISNKLQFNNIMNITHANSTQEFYVRSILQTSDGRIWIFPFDMHNYNSGFGGITTMYYNYSDDGGSTWTGGVLAKGSGYVWPSGVELGNGTLLVLFDGDYIQRNVPSTIYEIKYSSGSWSNVSKFPMNIWHSWGPSAAHGPNGVYIAFTSMGIGQYNLADNDIYIITPRPVYQGVAPEALILSGKVLNKFGWGYSSWVINGIEWAVNNSADIISLSLGDGFTDGTDPVSLECDWATDQGVVVVVAAGNAGYWYPYFSITAPGTARKVITVGASDKSDNIADWSSRGPTIDYRVKPDLVAPGVNIVAARASGTSMGNPVNDYYTMASGTSMATPHVAGVAALLLDYTRRNGVMLSPYDVKNYLISRADDLGQNIYVQGGGRINITKVLSSYDVSVEPAEISFGGFSLGSLKSRLISIKNIGQNTLSFNLTAETEDIISGEYISKLNRNIVMLNATSLTVSPGEVKYINLTIVANESGFYSGKLFMKDNLSRSYEVIFGAFIGLNLTVNKINFNGEPAAYNEVNIFKLNPINYFDEWLNSRWGAYTDENGNLSLLLTSGKYEVVSFSYNDSDPIFTIKDSVNLNTSRSITLDERKVNTIYFDPNKTGQVIAQKSLVIEFENWTGSTYIGFSQLFISYYPSTTKAYISNTSVFSVGCRYTYYPYKDVSPSDPETISTDIWYDLIYTMKGIQGNIDIVANYSYTVQKYTEYRTSASQKYSAQQAIWSSMWNASSSADFYGTFVWNINLPCSRLEIISPSPENGYTAYYGYLWKYRDLPGVSTPWWDIWGWIYSPEPGGKTEEVWNREPLIPMWLWIDFWKYDSKSNETYVIGHMFANPTAHYNEYKRRYSEENVISVKVYRNDTQLEPYIINTWGGYFWFWLYDQPGNSVYRVVGDANAIASLSSKTHLEFTYKLLSNGTILRSPAVDKIIVRNISLNNTVSTSPINIELSMWNESSLSNLTAEYSTDDGATWISIPVKHIQFNKYGFTIPIKEGGKFISLRINASDSNENNMSCTTIRGFYVEKKLMYNVVNVFSVENIDSNGSVYIDVYLNSSINLPGGLGAYKLNLTTTGPINITGAYPGADFNSSVAYNMIGNKIFIAGYTSDKVGPQLNNIDIVRLRLTLYGSTGIECYIKPVNLTIVDAGSGVKYDVVVNGTSMSFMRGDANNDGRVNIVDAMFIAQYLAGNRPASQLNLLNAASVKHDQNSDKINIADAMFIAQYLVGLRDSNFNII